jgi:[ribosomal protein S5]-alanine N-acetyltransferase
VFCTKMKVLKGKKVSLRAPETGDCAEYIELVRKSEKFHRGLVKMPKTEEGFLKFLERSKGETNAGFLIIRSEDNAIAGTAMLSQIFYGALCSAYLGYWLGAGFTGQGLMTEAVRLMVRHAFIDLKLHRIEANIQPENQPSINVVKRAGFVKEGFSEKYLKVAGRWRDHERWAITREIWKPKREEEKGR